MIWVTSGTERGLGGNTDAIRIHSTRGGGDLTVTSTLSAETNARSDGSAEKSQGEGPGNSLTIF